MTGATGQARSLVQRSWDAAMAVDGIDAVYVTTDDVRIADAARMFGADVIMTSKECQNGTERCAQALSSLDPSVDVIVNLQGDAPLTPSWFVEDLVATMRADPKVSVATPVLRCDVGTYGNFVEDRRNGRVGGTTAVFDKAMNGLYFSKEIIPYIDPKIWVLRVCLSSTTWAFMPTDGML